MSKNIPVLTILGTFNFYAINGTFYSRDEMVCFYIYTFATV